MAKVFNKKNGMYKGSLPGMRMGGVPRAPEGTETTEEVVNDVPIEESRGWPYTEVNSSGDGFDMYNQPDIYGNPRKGMIERLTTEGPYSAITGSAPGRWLNTAYTVASDEIPRAFGFKKGGTTKGTVLGGKYKKGGSTKSHGRNGVL